MMGPVTHCGSTRQRITFGLAVQLTLAFNASGQSSRPDSIAMPTVRATSC